MLKVVHGEAETNKHALAAVGRSLLDEPVRDGARQMLGVALQAEVAAYVEAFADQVDGAGHRAEREVATAAGECQWGRRGSTTSTSSPGLASGSGSPPRSCRRGPGSHRRSHEVTEYLAPTASGA